MTSTLEDLTDLTVPTTGEVAEATGATEVAEATEATEATGVAESARASETSVVTDASPVPVQQVDQAPTGLVEVEVDHLEYVYYALAHNKVPIVQRILLRAGSGKTLHDVTIRVELLERGQAIGQPWEREIGRLSGQTVFQQVELILDPTRMSQVEEARPAELVVTVASETEVHAVQRRPVTLLAHNQWTSERGREMLSLQTLAAFCQPNHPQLQPVLHGASRVLEARTGDGSREGYQRGRADRVDQIAGSVYESMRALKIDYSNPPASWDIPSGQKIRTAEQVLEPGGAATCLDTAVTYAAALEQSGLNALIVVVNGHAFAAYWTEEAWLRDAVVTDLNVLAALVDEGRIRLVETTTMTAGASRSFQDAVRANNWRLGDSEAFLGVVDVARARLEGVVPLPVSARQADGSTVMIEYQPPVINVGDRNAPGRTRTSTSNGGRLEDRAPERVQRWKSALLDLSLRNALINYNPERKGVRLAIPPELLGRFEDIIHGGHHVDLRPHDAIAEIQRERGARFVTDLGVERLATELLGEGVAYVALEESVYHSRLRSLARKARSIEEETGANNLYLALGTLVWSDGDRELTSPLFLVPVRLSGGGRKSPFVVTVEDGGIATPNYSLLERLRRDGFSVPELDNPALDASGIDLDASIKAVRTAITEAGYTYRVDETADLAILQFSKFRLWKDIDDHWETFQANTVVRHLVETPTQPFVDPTASRETATATAGRAEDMCPIPVDGSQLTAVEAALAGQSFVLEGPPGTGKSQTITNLLAAAVADGKKVLFVAEKPAALEVVKRRLDSVGLAPFSLDLHAKGSTSVQIREQLSEALNHRVALDREGLDAATSKRSSASRELESYARRLHEKNVLGISLWEARNKALAWGEGPALTVSPAFAEQDTKALAQVREILAELPAVADAARLEPGHPWSFVSGESFAPVDRAALADAVRRVVASTQALPTDDPVLGPAVRAAGSPADLRLLHMMAAGHLPAAHVLARVHNPAWEALAEGAMRSVDALAVSHRELFDLVGPQALREDLPRLRAEAVAAAQGAFGTRRRGLKRVATALAPYMGELAVLRPKEVIPVLDELIFVAKEVAQLRDHLASVPGLVIGPDWSPYDQASRAQLSAQIDWLRWAASRTSADTAFARALHAVGNARTNDELAVHGLHMSAEAFGALGTAVGSDESAWSHWSGERGLAAATRSAVSTWERDARDGRFLALQRWYELHGHVAPLTGVGLDELRRAIIAGEVVLEEVESSFERGLARMALAERLEATSLDTFDGARHERQVARFVDSDSQIRELLTDAIPYELLSGRPFAPGVATGQVGALARELDKKRGLPVRTLLRRYPDVVSELTPCFLMSPDSVAQFLEPGKFQFDLVVFDEASQIRVAEAIGAMGRAKSVVVVGDSKQMPPTTFAEAALGGDGGFDADPDELALTVPEDQESILSEAVQAGLPRHWLSWHYRSRDEALIAFSNVRYYEGRLSTFPAPRISPDGVRFVRVDGHFHRSDSSSGKKLRTNPVEAQAVVAEIRRRLNDPATAGQSIGVVTFNTQQRDLIMDLLDRLDDPAVNDAREDAPDDEQIFVKNLESVQGDERDVILFSIAFSKNAAGNLPLNFGPLNRVGGERRLNVAVTRARAQVVVFCSFDPGDLKAENTSSEGLRHLKEYLTLAAEGVQSSGDLTARGLTDHSEVRHRDEIAERLRERGLEVTTGLGLSDFQVDLAVAHPEDPDTPVLAVLLDGPTWAGRRLVADRDALPVAVLQRQMGWPAVARVWLPMWLQSSDEVVAEIEQAVQDAHLRPGAASTSVEGSASAGTTPPAAGLDPRAASGTRADIGRNRDRRHRDAQRPWRCLPPWQRADPRGSHSA